MNAKFPSCIVIAWMTGTLLTAIAALPPRGPADLEKAATLIIIGTVTGAEVATEGKRNFSDSVHSLKVRVGAVEKGEGVSPGDGLDIRCWHMKKRPDGWAGPAGHFSIPKKDERFRMWLRKRDDGAWEPLQPNGIEILGAAEDPAIPDPPDPDAEPEEEVHPIDAVMEKAIEANPSTGGQTEAIDNALKQWDVELNRHYQTLVKRLDADAAVSLRQSQRKWIVWRDQEIESLRAFFSKMDGTMWVPMAAHAEMKLTRDRALDLGRLAELSEMRGLEGDADADAGEFEWLADEGIGGIRLDLPAAVVLKKVEGEPTRGKDEFWAATGEWVEPWAWVKQGLAVDMASRTEKGERRVSSVTIEAPSPLKTARGIGIGSPETEVRKAYADVEDREGGESKTPFVAGSVYGGVIFEFKDGRVESIFLGAAAE